MRSYTTLLHSRVLMLERRIIDKLFRRQLHPASPRGCVKARPEAALSWEKPPSCSPSVTSVLSRSPPQTLLSRCSHGRTPSPPFIAECADRIHRSSCFKSIVRILRRRRNNRPHRLGSTIVVDIHDVRLRHCSSQKMLRTALRYSQAFKSASAYILIEAGGGLGSDSDRWR